MWPHPSPVDFNLDLGELRTLVARLRSSSDGPVMSVGSTGEGPRE